MVKKKKKKKKRKSMEKGEIARYEQFLLFQTAFSKDLYSRHLKTNACLGRQKTF